MAESVVLDTSACLTLLENEAGADEVEARLLAANEGVLQLYASFVTLTEIEYIITRERGGRAAAAILEKVKAWPISWMHSDEALCAQAAKLKAAHTLALADAFVAATALRVNARLIHKDPEFTAIGRPLKQQMLPPKN